MSFEEFSYWKVFDRRIAPFGDEWRQTATVAFAAGGDKFDRSVVKELDDLMPFWWPDVSKELEQEARAAQAAHEKWREANEVEEDDGHDCY